MFDGRDFIWLFFKGLFEIFRSKMKNIIYGNSIVSFILVLMFLKWFECFHKRLGFTSSTKTLNCYFLWYLHEICWFKMNWYRKIFNKFQTRRTFLIHEFILRRDMAALVHLVRTRLLKKPVKFVQIQHQENHKKSACCHFDVILTTLN